MAHMCEVTVIRCEVNRDGTHAYTTVQTTLKCAHHRPIRWTHGQNYNDRSKVKGLFTTRRFGGKYGGKMNSIELRDEENTHQ